MKETQVSSKLVPLSREFFSRKTVEVARDLLGKNLVRKIDDKTLVARIVEVEAYLGERDPAAHASFGRTERTEPLYGGPGHAYIFRIHGYNCLNAVVEPRNVPGCVLIRAAEPILGLGLMREFRQRKGGEDRGLTDGPGKLCQALNIDMSLCVADMTSANSPLRICEDYSDESFEIEVSKRIGITKAADWKLRFRCVGESRK